MLIKKIPDTTGLVTTTVLNTKISGLLKKKNNNRLWHKNWWIWKGNTDQDDPEYITTQEF